ncbi:MAG: mannose-1-phosphate guanylyltransferase/mannose-6-phosphate isomerase, partial [Halioglobus sp.]
MLTPVILSGGVGSRLWPISREYHPKQFLPLAGELSMLQETLQRTGSVEETPPLVVCNEEHRFMVAEQLRQIDLSAGAIILEPQGRNTAPAVALAAIHAQLNDPEAVLLVLPADHLIQDVEAFVAAVEKALPFAQQGHLMTFGIEPSSPETSYGYIKRGSDIAPDIFKLNQFVEKPDEVTATAYLQDGSYLWNSGMFLLRAATYLEELARCAPEMMRCCSEAMQNAQVDMDFLRPEREAFLACPSDSIDYAVMEKTDLGAVVSLNCGWNDIGAWSALWEVAERDAQGNVLRGDV